MILNTKINGEYEMYICKGCGFASETDVLDSDDLCFGCANDTNETLVRISVCPATCSGFIRPGVSV